LNSQLIPRRCVAADFISPYLYGDRAELQITLGICTDLQFNEWVAPTEQGDTSPTETCGAASIVFNPEGYPK
jgi:hypothetical protein